MRRSIVPILTIALVTALALVLSGCSGGVRTTSPTTSTLPFGAVATTSPDLLGEEGEGEAGAEGGAESAESGEQAPVPSAGQEPATSGAGAGPTTSTRARVGSTTSSTAGG